MEPEVARTVVAQAIGCLGDYVRTYGADGEVEVILPLLPAALEGIGAEQPEGLVSGRQPLSYGQTHGEASVPLQTRSRLSVAVTLLYRPKGLLPTRWQDHARVNAFKAALGNQQSLLGGPLRVVPSVGALGVESDATGRRHLRISATLELEWVAGLTGHGGASVLATPGSHVVVGHVNNPPDGLLAQHLGLQSSRVLAWVESLPGVAEVDAGGHEFDYGVLAPAQGQSPEVSHPGTG